MNLTIQLVIDKRETDLMESLRKCVATNDYNFQQIQITSDVLTFLVGSDICLDMFSYIFLYDIPAFLK